MKLRVLAGMLLAAFGLTAPAVASPPVLSAAGQERFHPWATFSAPGADSVTIYFATGPERATDGTFFEENVTGSETLTDEEIAAGRWLSEETFGSSGMRWVMLSASTPSCPDGQDCLDGYSNVLKLSVPPRTLSVQAARDAIDDTLEDRFVRTYESAQIDAYQPEPVRKCARLSRLRIRCSVEWFAGDIGYRGKATVIRRFGEQDDHVRWAVTETNYYCLNNDGRRCERTYRGG